jgi:hypothetical protein
VVTVFFGRRWSGQPQESEEMSPGWFDLASLPLDQMWDDEAYWLPRVMAEVIAYGDACKRVTLAKRTAASTQAGLVQPG